MGTLFSPSLNKNEKKRSGYARLGGTGAISDYSWQIGGVCYLFAMSGMLCVVYTLQYKVVTLLQPVISVLFIVHYISMALLITVEYSVEYCMHAPLHVLFTLHLVLSCSIVYTACIVYATHCTELFMLHAATYTTLTTHLIRILDFLFLCQGGAY